MKKAEKEVVIARVIKDMAKLWIRKFDCGHIRETNIDYLLGNYNKPKIGSKSYCRFCEKEVIITDVAEVKDEIYKENLDVMRTVMRR